MKNLLKIFFITAAAAFVLISCPNSFLNKDKNGSELQLPPGYGIARISLVQGDSRTAVPDIAGVPLTYEFFYLDEKEEPVPVEYERDSAGFYTIILELGEYFIRIQAYYEDEGGKYLIAEGQEIVNVTPVLLNPVEILLTPFVDEGSGKFDVTLIYPANVEDVIISLTSLSGFFTDGEGGTDVAFIANSAKPDAGNTTITYNHLYEVPAGFYLFNVELLNIYNAVAYKTDVVHIVQGITTVLNKEDYTFKAGEFLYLVTNGDDYYAGVLVVAPESPIPGTLRYVLEKAPQDAVIRVMPDVKEINLLNTLTINKNITIEGNSVKIGPAGKENSIQLISINNTTINITIKRVHFTGGNWTNGGAIYSNGNLTLESCIFSENTASGFGGAVYNDGTLNVRGCTFYNNKVENENTQPSNAGGAIYSNSNNALLLIGNIFYENLDNNYIGNVFNNAINDISEDIIYNLFDVWHGDSENKNDIFESYGVIGIPFNDEFSLLNVPYIKDSLSMPSSINFPATDFYGNPRTNRIPGAVVNINHIVV